MTVATVQAPPLVAVVSGIPLLCEALAGSLDGIAEVRRFRVGTSDTPGLLRSVRANAVVVDAEDEALAAAPFARATGAPIVHVAMREQTLRVLDASGWHDFPGGFSVDAIRNVLLGGVYGGEAARGNEGRVRGRASRLSARWQVRGGSRPPFEEMARLDHLYVTRRSLRRDLAVLLSTVRLVLRGAGEAF